MDEIHHLESMGETMIHGYLQGNRIRNPGFLEGGAKCLDFATIHSPRYLREKEKNNTSRDARGWALKIKKSSTLRSCSTSTLCSMGLGSRPRGDVRGEHGCVTFLSGPPPKIVGGPCGVLAKPHKNGRPQERHTRMEPLGVALKLRGW